MLFDLSSPKRKNVVRVVYGALALLFAGGFIFFGIGSESGAGGLFDGLFGDGGGGSTAEQFEQQVEDAEERLDSNPEDQRALQQLAYYRAQSGISQLEQDESTGLPVVTEDARGELEAAIEAWNRYLETDPQRPDLATASQIVQAYVLFNDAEGAADTQEIVAETNPSSAQYARLANYRYADFDFKAGDKAKERALEEANPNQRKAIEKQLDQIREALVKQQKQLEKQGGSTDGAEGGLNSPFGGLSPESGLPPTTP
jgi:tetratricopeptide (TPR) repeat protein